MTHQTLVEKLRKVEAEIRERARQHSESALWACQSESSWHASEYAAWADEIADALTGQEGAAPSPTCPTHGDPLVCLPCEAEEDKHWPCVRCDGLPPGEASSAGDLCHCDTGREQICPMCGHLFEGAAPSPRADQEATVVEPWKPVRIGKKHTYFQCPRCLVARVTEWCPPPCNTQSLAFKRMKESR